MLVVGPNSARTFTSNKKLTSVDDFKGQKFRMPANPIHVGIATDLGASAQIIPLNDLFNALQTGVVDGQDNGMVTVASEHLNEVQKYLYETNHIVTTMEIIVNAGLYDRLPEDTRRIISDAARETALFAWDLYIKSVDTDRELIKKSGVTVTPCSPADQQRIITAIQPTLKRDNRHLMIDTLVLRTPKPVQIGIYTVIQACIIWLMAILVRGSWGLVVQNRNNRWVVTGFPAHVVHFFGVILGVSIILIAVSNLIRLFVFGGACSKREPCGAYYAAFGTHDYLRRHRQCFN